MNGVRFHVQVQCGDPQSHATIKERIERDQTHTDFITPWACYGRNIDTFVSLHDVRIYRVTVNSHLPLYLTITSKYTLFFFIAGTSKHSCFKNL